MNDKSFIPDYIADKLKKIGEVEFAGNKKYSGNNLSEKLADKDVLITGWGQPLIKKEDLGSVKLIAHTGGTVGGIVDMGVFDTDVKVISGNQYYAESVAEGVLAYMLFALRDMGKYTGELAKGNWLPNFTEGLLDQTVGIISLGAISRMLIPLLSMFRTKIKVYSKTSHDEEFAKQWGFEFAGLDEIFSTCKIVSVHTARCPETEKMINAHHFKLLKEGSIFLNTSRGSVIDEDALVESLKERKFKAVLDVYNEEPLPSSSKLIGLDNVILFPHQAGPTYDRRKYITEKLIEDIVSFFDGRDMKNLISKDVAKKMTIS